MADDLAAIAHAKDALRARQRQERAKLFAITSPVTYSRAAQHFMKSVEIPRGGVVAGFWPLKDEFDCRPLLMALAGHGVPLALPVVVRDSGSLVFREWQPDMTLEPAGFGTLGPAESSKELMPSLLIIPFLAFDRQCYRLGYGGGFYDRTLAGLRNAAICKQAIGLGFSAQRVQQVPVTPNDARLDAVVTEEGVIRPRPVAPPDANS